MKRSALIFCPVLLLSTSAHALQIKQATDNAQITATLSAKETSRISVAKDRIRMSSGNEQLDITSDSESGDIYIKPIQPPLNKPVNLFITTEKNMTYQLLLLPKDVPSEQILIRDDALVNGTPEARAFERKSPFHHTVIEVLKATIGTAALPVGYKQVAIKKAKKRFQKPFEITPLYRVNGAALQGVALQVKNTADTTVSLSERDLFKQGQLAVYLSQRKLKPGETTRVYIVQHRAGED